MSEFRPSFYEMGPPDPINYLRGTSVGRPRNDDASSSDLRHLDSDDEGLGILSRHESDDEDDGHKKEPNDNGNESNKKEEEPPARERPRGDVWPYRETLSFTRSLVFYGAGSITAESEIACASIQRCRTLRQKYQGSKGTIIRAGDVITSKEVTFRIGHEGVAEIYHASMPNENIIQVPSVEKFSKDYHRVVEMVSDGAMRSFCFQRLQMLSTSFKMHTTLNHTIEQEEQNSLLGTDFYRTLKIDNHIHAAAAMSSKQFVEYVRRKLESEGDTVVNEKGQTLEEAFKEAGLDKDHLTIDAFNVLADYSVYQRFDNFNRCVWPRNGLLVCDVRQSHHCLFIFLSTMYPPHSKYSPFRLADMRRIFLKTTNYLDGRYFAELLKIVIDRHEKSKGHNSACEMRLSIYGMERHEWLDLAKWVLRDWDHEDFPGPMLSTHNRWHVQIPRLWRIFSKKPVEDGKPARSFLEMIENIFVPMFEATLYPDKFPEVAELLKHIVAIDSVDDEGSLEEPCTCQRPHEWKTTKNPAYWWQLYFLWANLEVLNQLRASRGLNTIAFRPHAGETGDPMHLAATYMLCESINHGVLLDMQVSLQYLYYLDQVGLSISPLSNNFLFRKVRYHTMSMETALFHHLMCTLTRQIFASSKRLPPIPFPNSFDVG